MFVKKQTICDRQGDVLLLRVDSIPADATEEQHAERVVLREGEATGHAHAFYGERVRVFVTPKRERFLRVVETSRLRHEEHTTIDVPPGDYQLPTQVEWTDEQEPRVVAD